MADHTTYLSEAKLQRQNDVGLYAINKRVALANSTGATGGSQNDTQQLIPISRAGRIYAGGVQHDGTLGASCTLTLRRNRGGTRTAMTAATTAGGAGQALLTKPIDVAADDVIEILIGGANVGAAATVDVDLLIQHT